MRPLTLLALNVQIRMSARGGKKKATKLSRSARAGVIFPVGRMMRYLRTGTHKYRIGMGAPVYMAAVIEYLAGRMAPQLSRFLPTHIAVAHHRASVKCEWLEPSPCSLHIEILSQKLSPRIHELYKYTRSIWYQILGQSTKLPLCKSCALCKCSAVHDAGFTKKNKKLHEEFGFLFCSVAKFLYISATISRSWSI